MAMLLWCHFAAPIFFAGQWFLAYSSPPNSHFGRILLKALELPGTGKIDELIKQFYQSRNELMDYALDRT